MTSYEKTELMKQLDVLQTRIARLAAEEGRQIAQVSLQADDSATFKTLQAVTMLLQAHSAVDVQIVATLQAMASLIPVDDESPIYTRRR